jgi:hypothetical protein
MEFPMGTWEVFPASDFNQASVRDPGELGMESLIQVRSTGRMLGHFQVLIGGNRCRKLEVPLRDVLPFEEPAEAVLTYEVYSPQHVHLGVVRPEGAGGGQRDSGCRAHQQQ